MMCYEELSDRVRQFKETEEGVDEMCDILDEMRNEAGLPEIPATLLFFL